MNFENGINRGEPKTEHGANKSWAESVKQEEQEIENGIRSKFVDPEKFEEIIGEFQGNKVFNQKRNEILKEVENRIGKKQKPQEDDPFMDQGEWDEGLAETVKNTIEEAIKERS